MNNMTKILLIALGGFVLLGLIIVGFFVGNYNSLVGLSEDVDGQWGNVEVQYQRRMDLIPNLIETVKGYASHEKEVLTEITAARSAWSGASSSGEKVAAANQMEGALNRLMVVVENYPDLKAATNFLAFQDELAGTENRISVERKRYNDIVTAYNKKVKRFPTNMIASMFGFEAKEFFKAQSGAENAPAVKF